jgi:RNA polymerase sigma-70 factor (ECF subfamily)
MTETTSWTLIRSAADGDGAARAEFARRYLPVIRAYLHARWQRRLGPDEVEDTVQEVFLECFRDEGILDRVSSIRSQGFRSFLYGAARHVALRVEERKARRPDCPGAETFYGDEREVDEPSLSEVFDRAWAHATMEEAGELQAARAHEAGKAALGRVELLRLRFQENLNIRDVAKLWKTEAAALHHQYALARREFESALHDVVSEQQPGTAESIRRTCLELLSLLG